MSLEEDTSSRLAAHSLCPYLCLYSKGWVQQKVLAAVVVVVVVAVVLKDALEIIHVY